MSTPELVPGDVLGQLEGNRFELHHLAEGLANVERELHGTMANPGLEAAYRAYIDDYEIGLWTAHVDDGAKLPAKDLRLQLAHRSMDPALYGRYFALVKSRERMLSRISTLRVEIDAQRSILSALKEGLVHT